MAQFGSTQVREDFEITVPVIDRQVEIAQAAIEAVYRSPGGDLARCKIPLASCRNRVVSTVVDVIP